VLRLRSCSARRAARSQEAATAYGSDRSPGGRIDGVGFINTSGVRQIMIGYSFETFAMIPSRATPGREHERSRDGSVAARVDSRVVQQELGTQPGAERRPAAAGQDGGMPALCAAGSADPLRTHEGRGWPERLDPAMTADGRWASPTSGSCRGGRQAPSVLRCRPALGRAAPVRAASSALSTRKGARTGSRFWCGDSAAQRSSVEVPGCPNAVLRPRVQRVVDPVIH